MAKMSGREKLLLASLAVFGAAVAMTLPDPDVEAGEQAVVVTPDLLTVETSYVELTTVDGVDYPICSVEDCSDQVGQIGVWIDPDTGNRWLSVGEYSLFVEPEINHGPEQ